MALLCTVVLAMLPPDEDDWNGGTVDLGDYRVDASDYVVDTDATDDDEGSESVSREEAMARFFGGIVQASVGIDTPDSRRALDAVARTSPELMFQMSLLEALSED